MLLGHMYLKGENTHFHESTVIVFMEGDDIKRSTLENIIIKRELESINLLFSACVLINSQQEKPTRKVIQIGGFYCQTTVPDLPYIRIESCVLKNCTIPFENIYMIDCVIKHEKTIGE